MIEDLIRQWDGFAVVTGHDAETDCWFFIAMHDITLGVAVGGTRMKIYDTPADGLRDAMRLAEGMTNKWAGVGIPYGGGKGVIALSQPAAYGDRERLLRSYGRLLGSLHGAFMTGQDLGTFPEDMVMIAREGKYVHGVDLESGSAIDPGPYTARGVMVGIRAAVRDAFGSDDLTGRSVLIQGAGDVGGPLADELHAAGATLLISDVDADRAKAVAARVHGRIVAPENVYGTSCDVYAPCAVGATVNAETIPNLACRIVAGSANNQLAEIKDAERLRAHGILYAPDYIINGGGAAAFGLMAQGIKDEAALMAKVEGIEQVLGGIFREAKARDESPVAAAQRAVDRVLGRSAA